MSKLQVIRTAKEMVELSNSAISKGQKVGFVPTMGALHAGHASLIQKAKDECDVVVVSVFVNPTQFNEKSDLENYPRTFDQDKKLLDELQIDVMFYPSNSEIYPNGTSVSYEMDGLDEVMEGVYRPGHFNGVVQVVTRLFELVKPTKAYFGEKDFQQLAIIRYMVKMLNLNVAIVGCPTLRETDGLAMSSRNVRLTSAGRKRAPIIYNVLVDLRNEIDNAGIFEAQEKARERLASADNLELEYLELVNAESLLPATNETEPIQACVAAWVDDVRLIDNLRVN